jgi:hypothetical protein
MEQRSEKLLKDKLAADWTHNIGSTLDPPLTLHYQRVISSQTIHLQRVSGIKLLLGDKGTKCCELKEMRELMGAWYRNKGSGS